MIRFMKHFVQDTATGCKAKIHYSIDNHISGKPCVTLYAQEYGYDLDKIFDNVENNTNSQIDYFEKSLVRIFEDSEYYTIARKAANAAHDAWTEHYNKIHAKRKRKNLKVVKS